ncbi:MAG TPA: cytochrome D1 domain-containing protein [Candidatus Angelobacter sp.]|nr:cytochrome D1 domain-containing protein [Candidatus Angelobacter sp.]
MTPPQKLIPVSEKQASSLLRTLSLGLLSLACSLPATAALAGQATAEKAQAQEAAQTVPANHQTAPARQKVTQGGITVQFEAGKAGTENATPGEIKEGEQAVVRFSLSEATGAPLSGSRPAVWIDARAGKPTDATQCHDKINSFLQASLGSRPTVDLNSYYILALNDEANISVIDPLLSFGASKLFTLVLLKSPGMDWLLTKDGRRLFVAMPEAGQVAVVDTATWKVIVNVDAGKNPTRLALQKDEKYLWVGNDAESGAESGVTVLDVALLKSVARFATGMGHHDIAFSAEDRYAFVTNQRAATLSVIDVQKLAAIKEIKTGASPVAPAFSKKSNAVYVAGEDDGSVIAVDAASHEVVARFADRPGTKSLRFAADGRWGFLANPLQNTVRVFDSASNRFVHTVTIENGPEQIAFSDRFAYIRARGSEQVSMLPLGELGKSQALVPADFPGGQVPPAQFRSPAAADTIVPSPESGSVLVANPADKIIYYYSEGMAAPMGNFQNYGRSPRAVLVVDRSLREVVPGTYSTTVSLPYGGTFDVAFFLDSPKVVHCFELSVAPNPVLKKQHQAAMKVEPLLPKNGLRVGETYHFRFKLTDPETARPIMALKDVMVLTFLAPGTRQQRRWAKPLEDGLYESEFTVPEPGAYYIFWECPSLGVLYNQVPPLIMMAAKPAAGLHDKERNAPPEEPAKANPGDGATAHD